MEDAAKLVYECAKDGMIGMIARMCLTAAHEYLREAALRAVGQWAEVEKESVDRAAAQAWHALRKFEEDEYRSGHNAFVESIKQQVLYQLLKSVLGAGLRRTGGWMFSTDACVRCVDLSLPPYFLIHLPNDLQ